MPVTECAFTTAEIELDADERFEEIDGLCVKLPQLEISDRVL